MNTAAVMMCLGAVLAPAVAMVAPAQTSPLSVHQAAELLRQHEFFISYNEENEELFNTVSARILSHLSHPHSPESQDYPWAAELLHLAELDETSYLLQPRILQAFLALGGDVNARDSFGRTAMEYALRLSPRRFLPLLVAAGAKVDIEQTDEDGMTPLLYAARDGDAECCAFLLNQGAYVNSFSSQGETALALALQRGDAACIDTLLTAGARMTPDVEDDAGRTLLYHAATAAPLRYVDMLLRAGAVVDAATHDGQTPLMEAAAEGRADVVQRLLAAGASPFARDANGEDALFLSVEAGDAACVESLLSALRKHQAFPGPDRLCELLELLRSWDDENHSVAKVLIKQGAQLDIERDGWNYLGDAIACADLELMHLLETAGVEYDAQTPDDNGVTYLMHAVRSGYMPMVEHLLKGGADYLARDNDGNDVLMHAFLCEDSAPVHRLLVAGASLNPRARLEPIGWTQLMLAAAQGDEVLVRLLLDSGADINARSDAGETALTMALSHGHAGIVKLLRSAGARFEPSERRNGGSTLLMYAAAGGLLEVVNELLAAGVDVDAMRHFPILASQPDVGATALMLAAEKGHEAVVRRLLSAGADPTLLDMVDKSAADYAHEAGHSSLAEWLRQAEKKARWQE